MFRWTPGSNFTSSTVASVTQPLSTFNVMTSVFVMNGMTIWMSSLVTGSKIIFTSRCTTASAIFSGMTRPNISTNSLTRSGRPALVGRYIIGRVSPTAAKEKPLLVAAACAHAGPGLAAAAVIAASAADRNRSRFVSMGCSSVTSVARGRGSRASKATRGMCLRPGRRRGPHECGPLDVASLLTWAVLDHLLDLLLHRLEVEGSRVLHRRIVDRRQRQLLDELLDQDEAPELAREEVLAVPEGAGVRRFTANIRRAFEGILPNIDDRGHVRGGLFARPAPRLRIERELEVVDAQRAQVCAAEVEDLVALGRALAGQQVHLVVAVEVVLVGPVAELHAFQQLLGDIRIARRGHQGGKPVEAGKDSILDRARPDGARPADDGRHAEAALADGAFGILEWRHAAVRPSEHLCAVVRGENDDGVAGLADVIEMLEQGADAVIELRHARFLETVVGLAVLHRAVLLQQERPDVHARGVVPDEERLAVALSLVHEVAVRLDQHLVEGRHVVLCLEERQVVHVRHVRHVRERWQRTFIDDPLLADFAPARHLGRIIRLGRVAVHQAARAVLVVVVLIDRERVPIRIGHRVEVV